MSTAWDMLHGSNGIPWMRNKADIMSLGVDVNTVSMSMVEATVIPPCGQLLDPVALRATACLSGDDSKAALVGLPGSISFRNRMAKIF